MPRRNLSALAVSVVVAATLTIPTVAAATPRQTHRGTVNEHVIVLLRNQHQNIPATHARARQRVEVTNADQSSLIKRARSQHATGVRQLHVINAFAMTASPSTVHNIAANSAVAGVFPDREIRLPSTTTAAARSARPGSPVSSKVCPTNPAKPLLEPQALQLTHTAYANSSRPSAQRLVTGAGVKVAFLADGLDPNNPDFIRADGSHVFIDYKDFSGDGPDAPTSAAEAFGDASAIAAQGRQTYDLSQYVNASHPLPAGCNIHIRGMAPGASLVGLKVFPAGGFAFNSAILAALDYAATVDKVDVINESFGSNQYPDTNDDPTALFNEELAASGITVVASSGDAAGENTIGSPASTPGVIAVGGTTAFRSYAQTTEAAFQLSNGKYRSDNISGLSSSGVTQPGRTIDLVAPGDLGWALCSQNVDIYQACFNNNNEPSDIQEFGGTSQSSPFVAGAAALVIQAYRQTHRGASPSAALVKKLLTGTAADLGLPGSEQGAGMLDSLRAVRAAESIHQRSQARGRGLIYSPTQLDVSTPSGSSVTRTVRVTNTGTHPVVLQPSLRSENSVLRRDVVGVPLSSTAQTFVDSFGITRGYTEQTFTVPRGTDRLQAQIAWPAPDKVVRATLLDPNGTFSAFTIPQGFGDFGSTDVHDPRPGVWTAILWTGFGPNGFNGQVQLTTTSFREGTVGSVRPREFVLRPGATRSVVARIPSGEAGDLADALQFAPESGHVGGVVPVVVRTLVATNSRGGDFNGSFSGGNGRAGIPNPSRTYDFGVPRHRSDLAVSVTVQGDPNEAIYGFLIDPNGEAVSEMTNFHFRPNGDVVVSPSIQFDHRAPQAGRWRLVFAVFGPVAGTSTITPYSGRVQYGLADVRAKGMPGNNDKLQSGVPVTATIRVTNRGVAANSYYVDPRATQRSDIALAGSNTSGYQLAPAPNPPFPAYLVPTETDALSVSATSDRPINFEVSPFPADHVTDLSFEGDPDREAGPPGTSPTVTVSDPIVAPQPWLALPAQLGPFPSTAPTATVDFTGSAHTAAFDQTVTSSTGDPQLAAVSDSPPPADAVTIKPGQSRTITVTFTPDGASHSVVSGVLYVNTYDSETGGSDEVYAIPYRYKIK